MSKLITHTQIGAEVYRLFEQAQRGIMIVSPYIKLHPDIKAVLKSKMQRNDFSIQILFGKNPLDQSKSLSKEDFEFFKGFKNVEIYYNPRLHAKYYGNESKGIITSLNLHEYSIMNNIEVGILMERSLLGLDGDNAMDSKTHDYFRQIIRSSEKVYLKEQKYDSFLLGLFTIDKGTIVKLDKSSAIYPSEGTKPTEERKGYCIRSGEQIPFNLNMPFTPKAYESWLRYKDPRYAEKFCHYSGEKSDGKTCFERPILSKNWKKAFPGV